MYILVKKTHKLEVRYLNVIVPAASVLFLILQIMHDSPLTKQGLDKERLAKYGIESISKDFATSKIFLNFQIKCYCFM